MIGMSRAERVMLVVGLALAFGALWGLGGMSGGGGIAGGLACGGLGVLVGGLLGLVIANS